MNKRIVVRIALALVAAALVPACKRSSSSGGSSTISGLMSLLKGGRGTAGNGGTGGRIEVYSRSASNIYILREGNVDSSFSVSVVKPALGTNPRTISANTTLAVGTGLTQSSVTILGDDAVNPATGLWVQAGVTLQLRPNFDTNASAISNEELRITVANGIFVEGAIKTLTKDSLAVGDGLLLHGADLRLVGQNFIVTSTGSVDTRGSDGPAATGGNGGFINITINGTIINAGTVTSFGGSGDTGGNGGLVLCYSNVYSVYNTGPVTSSGGAGAGGNGGNAGAIDFEGSENTTNSYGGCFNSAILTANGGNGTTGGGTGGFIYMSGYYLGATVNSGNASSNGGNATVSGNGGNAGGVQLETWSGTVRSTGTFSAKGGTSAAGTGGNGGFIGFAAYYDNTIFFGGVIGGIWAATSFDASGGDGATGGNAGRLYVETDSDNFARPTYDPIYLVGYSTFDAAAGNGTVNGGGPALDSFIENFFCHDGADTDGDGSPGPGNVYVGSITNEVDILLTGGSGTTGTGGAGADLAINTQTPDVAFENETVVPFFNRWLANSGRIDLGGGAGATTGGIGGNFFMFEQYSLTNTGAVTTSGGAGGSGVGGIGGFIEIISNDRCTVTGALAQNGGASTSANGGTQATFTFGGATYSLLVIGRTTTCTGGASANGGNNTGGATGGAGGTINITGTENSPTVSGTFSAAGGTGGTAGATGTVTINGVSLFLTNGAVTF